MKIYFILTKVNDENKGIHFKKEIENSLDFLFNNEVSKKLKEKIFLVDLKNKKGLVAFLSDLYGEFFFIKLNVSFLMKIIIIIMKIILKIMKIMKFTPKTKKNY